jgi:hypothetical protein
MSKKDWKIQKRFFEISKKIDKQLFGDEKAEKMYEENKQIILDT